MNKTSTMQLRVMKLMPTFTHEKNTIIQENIQNLIYGHNIISESKSWFPFDGVKGGFLDHPRFYRTWGSNSPFLLVVSNYSGMTPPPHYCMEQIAPVYCETATSFIVCYDTRAQAKDHITWAQYVDEKINRIQNTEVSL